MPEAPTPRTARSRSAILRAATDLCAELGYGSVTIEAIAAKAKVGKPTVYRWWPSKHAVLLDAMLEIGAEFSISTSPTGDVVADLRAWLHNCADTLNDPTLRPLITGVLGAAQTDPALKTAIRDRMHIPLRARNQTDLVAAQEAGQLPHLDLDLLEDALVAPLWYRLLVSGEPFDRAFADAVLAQVLRLD